MDSGPPDAKRVRINSDSWSGGHPEQYPPRDPRALPRPPPYPPQHPYTQPTAQVPPPHPQDDRRPRDPDYPATVQDPYRPPAGAPSYHTPFSGPGSREPMVVMKRETSEVRRDPSEDAMHPHSLRPHSTGDIHQEHVYPPPQEDHRRQSMAGYDGLNGPLTQSFRPVPPYAAAPPPPPAVPMYERPPYDPPPTPGALRDSMYAGGMPPSQYHSSSSASNQRKKTPRTSQACNQCRTAKGKCDDPKPCTSCKEKGLICEFKPPEPKQGDRQLNDIAAALERMERRQQEDSKRTKRLEKKIVIIQKNQSVLAKGGVPGSEGDVKSEEEEDEETMSVYDGTPPPRPSPSEVNYRTSNMDLGYAGSPKIEIDEEEAGKQIIPNEPAIPDGHTTAAAKLLRWPAIEALIGDKLKEDRIRDNYPSLKEMKHGIRIWGRGPTQAPSPEYTGAGDDSNADFTSPSPGAENVYGQLGGGTPPSYTYRREGDLKAPPSDDLLNLSRGVVRRLTESYMKHMQIMHPILDPQKLHEFTNELLGALPLDTPKSKPPGFVGHAVIEPPTKKQKRSPVATGTVGVGVLTDSGETCNIKPGALRPSIKTAIVLLVLGLGEMCEYKDKIPNLVPDNETVFDSPSVQNGWQSPMQASPALMSSNSSGLPSPQEGDRTARNPRRSSVDGQAHHTGRHPSYRPGEPHRNMDVIPGMKYVAPATDILGNENGEYPPSTDGLYHAHANILASLYFGQMARPFRSHYFINAASYIIQNMLKVKPQNFAEIKEKYLSVPLAEGSSNKNQVAFAFWTTLQLESDIVAELDLTHSGITTLENSIPWPNLDLALQTKQISDQLQKESYAAQLVLRNHLNTIHKDIYSSGTEDNFKLSTYKNNTQSRLYRVIDTLIATIPQIIGLYAWTDDNILPTDILTARLRAKFYGTQVITYRPFLMMVLNRTSRFPAVDGKSPMELDPPAEEDIPDRVMHFARACITALINSTKVFYGMPQKERLIITNPWGTAHAQFGNVLVLQAAYNDPKLQPFIDRNTLKQLVEGTLKFLSNVADRDSSLNIDIRLLKHAARKLHLIDPDSHLNSSFSSTTTGPVFEGTPLPHPLQ